MDGLDDFEKQLAADKAERERSERKHEHKHHHRKEHREHRHHHHSDDKHSHRDRRDDDENDKRRRRDDDEKHRHKRRRNSNDNDRHHKHRTRDSKAQDKAKDETAVKRDSKAEDKPKDESVQRDSWMVAPSALDIEHVHRKQPKEKTPPAEPPKRIISRREINHGLDSAEPKPRTQQPQYTFGDSGSSWRMTKLKAVYTLAESSGRPVDDIAIERFGSLEEFDDAREEQQDLERRKSYGKGYQGKEKPTGELFRQRKPAAQQENEQQSAAAVIEEEQDRIAAAIVPVLDQTALNRLRAQMMKAKLRRAPNAAQLELEYNKAAARAASNVSANQAVVLGVMDSRQLAGTRAEAKIVDTKRGRERGTLVENDDMTIDDMLREERRTKGQAGGEGLRLAERIAKDGKFDNDLDYMDENADKLAKRVHKSEINLKNMAVHDFQKMNKILDSCPLCHHEDTGKQPLAPVISLGTRTFVTLPTEPEISDGGAVIVPISHRKNLLECDDDEWEEIRNFMKSLTRMYHEQGREVIFYENAAAPHRHMHAAMMAIPIPYEEGATAPAYFKEAFLSSDEEWSQHRKIIDTGAKAKESMGRMAFRRSIAKEMPYFHVWFTLDGGLGHIIEDAGRWPKGDLFAREVIAGIVDAEPHIIKKQGRWNKGDGRVEGWKKMWRKFDWTRVLEVGE